MSIRVPNDTVEVIENLIHASKHSMTYVPRHGEVLMKSAIIDAENLLAEIRAEAKERGEMPL